MTNRKGTSLWSICKKCGKTTGGAWADMFSKADGGCKCGWVKKKK